MRSPGSTVATTITFANGRASAIKVFWLDFNGQRVPYLTVAPQGSALQQTFVGHIWVATDEQGTCLDVHVATAAPITVTIGR